MCSVYASSPSFKAPQLPMLLLPFVRIHVNEIIVSPFDGILLKSFHIPSNGMTCIQNIYRHTMFSSSVDVIRYQTFTILFFMLDNNTCGNICSCHCSVFTRRNFLISYTNDDDDTIQVTDTKHAIDSG